MTPRIRLKPSWPGAKLRVESLDQLIVPTIAPDLLGVPGAGAGIVDPSLTPEEIGDAANGTSSAVVEVMPPAPIGDTGVSADVVFNSEATPGQVGEPPTGSSSSYVEAVAQMDTAQVEAGSDMIAPPTEILDAPLDSTTGVTVDTLIADGSLSGGSYTTTETPSSTNSGETIAAAPNGVAVSADVVTSTTTAAVTLPILEPVVDAVSAPASPAKPAALAASMGESVGGSTALAASATAAGRVEQPSREVPHVSDPGPVVGNGDSYVRTVVRESNLASSLAERSPPNNSTGSSEIVPSNPMGTVEPPMPEAVNPSAVPTPELEKPVMDSFTEPVLPLPLPNVEGAVPSTGRYVPFEPSALDESIQRFMNSLTEEQRTEGDNGKAIAAISAAVLGLGAATTAYTRREQIKQHLPKALTLSKLLTLTR